MDLNKLKTYSDLTTEATELHNQLKEMIRKSLNAYMVDISDDFKNFFVNRDFTAFDHNANYGNLNIGLKFTNEFKDSPGGFYILVNCNEYKETHSVKIQYINVPYTYDSKNYTDISGMIKYTRHEIHSLNTAIRRYEDNNFILELLTSENEIDPTFSSMYYLLDYLFPDSKDEPE